MTEVNPRTPEDVIANALRESGGNYQSTADRIMRELKLAGFDVVDTIKPDGPVFTRDQVEAAWNAGADMVINDGDLQIGGRDTDLVNLVCNAIGTCLDNPGTDDLDDVILANYDPELDEEDEGLSDEDANAKRVRTVKGWIY